MPDFPGLPAAVFLALLWLLIEFIKKRTRQVSGYRFTGTNFLPPPVMTLRLRLYRLRMWFFRGALLFLLIALAGPRIGEETSTALQNGIAVTLLIDRSGSMQQGMIYQNQEVNRLEAVKRAIDAYLSYKLSDQNTAGDLIAVSSFAGFYEENAPFSSDYEGLKEFSQSITFAQKYEDGTMIGDALYQSVLRFSILDDAANNRSANNRSLIGANIKSRIIILLTDGEQTPGGLYTPDQAAAFAAENNIKVYTVSISGPNQGILGFNLGTFFGPGSRTLEQIAEKTNGSFARVESGEELNELYQTIDRLEKGDIPKSVTVYDEKYPIFLYVGLLLLLVYMGIEFYFAERII